MPVSATVKLTEGRPNVLDMLKNSQIDLIIITPSGSKTPREMVCSLQEYHKK